MRRLAHLALLVLVVAGAYYAINAGLTTRQLRAEHQRLAAEVGLLRVDDPDKVHIVSIPQESPLDCDWQMYVPAKFDRRWQVKLGEGSSSSSSSSGDTAAYYGLVRLRMRQDDRGAWTIWFKTKSSSNLMNLSNKDAELLLEQDALEVERAGEGELLMLTADEVCRLLRIRRRNRPDDKPILEISFGSPNAFKRAKASK
jgi:hypothetical protein